MRCRLRNDFAASGRDIRAADGGASRRRGRSLRYALHARQRKKGGRLYTRKPLRVMISYVKS